MNSVSAAPILPLPALQRKGGLRPEAHLLLGCARLTIGSDMRAEIEARMGSDLDCDQLRRLAARHALFPLLYRNLNVIAPTAIPRPLFVQLWAYHEKLCLRNQAMAEALLEILARLDSNGIPAIPFKGPALAQSVYGDLALREFGDLDILIRPKDLLAAKEAMKAAGFVPEYDLTPAVEAAFLRSSAQYHLVMRNEARDVLVELHWNLNP